MAYHRWATGTGLGNPNPCRLNNEWSNNEDFNNLIKEMLSDAIDNWFKKYEGCDFSIQFIDDTKCNILFGIEPAYEGDPLKVFCICSKKHGSFYETGHAWGAYGTEISKTFHCYDDFKKQSKFTRFVDKWSAKLTEALIA